MKQILLLLAFFHGLSECRSEFKTHYADYFRMRAYDSGVKFGNELLFWRRA